MPIFGPSRRVAAIFAALTAVSATPALAQSTTAGGLIATISDDRGVPLRGVTVTIEQGGTAFRIVETDRAGQVRLRSIPLGTYNVLAEQLGFQPVRALGARVSSGAVTSLSIRLVRKPPPINSVDEVPANATVTASNTGSTLDNHQLSLFDRDRDVGNASRILSSVDAPRDGRPGFVASAGGLRPGFTRLMVDGVEESLLRHPGLPGDAATTPLWSAAGMSQAFVADLPQDVEYRPALGALMSATSMRGNGAFQFHPYLAFSGAKLGGARADNPADSSAMSFEAGVSLSGPIKGDNATWYLRADYRQLETPSADPFVIGATDPSTAIRAAAQTVGSRDVSAWLAPTVRTWKGGNALGRVDFRVGRNADLSLRAGGAAWSEDNPQAGTESVNGAGARLEGRDISTAAALTTGGSDWESETRVGFRSAKRDWFGASLPFTGFVPEGIALGGAASLPGLFKEKAVEVNEAVTLERGAHTVKLGGNVQRRSVTNDFLPGSAGRYQFGGVAEFSAGVGSYYQAQRAGDAEQVSLTTLSLFAEDTWQITSALQLFAGFSFQKATLPLDQIGKSRIWGDASGLNNQLVPERQKAFAPRGGFAWSSGKTTLHGEAAIVSGQHDLNVFSEVVQFDGDVSVRRQLGTLAWPRVGEPSTAPFVGPSLTFYGEKVRAPKSKKLELSLTRELGSETSVSLTGGYSHSDYLLRREDLNRTVAPLSTGGDGRSIWGTLEQFGGMVAPAVGSNRRFREIDFAYGLTSTGYSDYYSATIELQRRVRQGVQLRASYTYSKTQDNLVGQLSADPADRLSPFADGRGATGWDSGRSDLDIPHRVAATAEYRSPGSNPLTVALRYRYRSGLPFTPGFQRGVDANGDGSAGNDPAFLGGTVSGMSELVGRESCLSGQGSGFAARNSCREKGVHGLDLRGAIGLPVGGARHVMLTLDAFNVVATETGLVDHAAVLVNPTGQITTNAAGRMVLPLIANTNFGKLLGRRGEGRLLRVGIRVEN